VKIEVHLDDDLIARKAAAIMTVDARGAVAKIYSGYTSTPKFASTPPNEDALYVGEKSLLLK
jgi:hypothetical protein